jgi:hypothetical protein
MAAAACSYRERANSNKSRRDRSSKRAAAVASSDAISTSRSLRSFGINVKTRTAFSMTFATVLFSCAEMIRNRASDADDREVELDLDFAFDISKPTTTSSHWVTDNYNAAASHHHHHSSSFSYNEIRRRTRYVMRINGLVDFLTVLCKPRKFSCSLL